MRIYIAYKYTNVPDKQKLQQDLKEISDHLESLGHTTFILGRDVQNWKKVHVPMITTIPAILNNLIKSDKLLAFVDCKSKSRGMLFELNFAKILGKEVILTINNDVQLNCFKKYGNKQINYENIQDLKEKLTNEL